MDLVLFGIQGSGKGTQAKILSENFNLAIFETGGELRKLAKQDSELGKKIKDLIDNGHLVSNEVVMEIVENFLNNVPADQRVLFDGLPRKLIQKETFDQLINKLGRQIIGLQIIVPEEKTINRLIKRGEIEGRADDTPEGIRNRIKAFYQETVPVIEKYKAEGKLLEANGDQSIKDVSKEIFQTLSPISLNRKVIKYLQEDGLTISIKDKQELAKMRESGKILGIILSEVEKLIKPGITTLEIDQYVEKRIREFDVRPAFKGYNGFPNCICANLNEQVVHGIPNNIPLQEGDILTVDCGVIYQGFYSDSAITVPVGKVADDIQKFIDTAYLALEKAIDVIRPGIRTNQISQAIENTIKKEGYNIVRDLSGHGIGKTLHEDPYILNYKERHLGPILQEGMVFAIEPIITMGKAETITLPDNWTIITRDKSLATQVEHTVAVTENGAEILTIRPK